MESDCRSKGMQIHPKSNYLPKWSKRELFTAENAEFAEIIMDKVKFKVDILFLCALCDLCG